MTQFDSLFAIVISIVGGIGWIIIFCHCMAVHFSRLETVAASKASELELEHEADYRDYLNKFLQGDAEHRLNDGTRVDILTETMAIEIDFAKKWYEAVGQAIHYGKKTNRTPVVLLIAKTPLDEKYVAAAKKAIPSVQVDGKSMSLIIFRDN